MGSKRKPPKWHRQAGLLVTICWAAMALAAANYGATGELTGGAPAHRRTPLKGAPEGLAEGAAGRFPSGHPVDEPYVG